MNIEAFIARGLQILLALGGAYLIATWFVLAIWTFRDIESRSRSVVTQVFSTLLVVLFWVPGLLLYWLLRPKETLDEAYQHSLEEEYLLQDLEEMPLCPTCNHLVQDDWQICPHCATQLREPCTNCGQLIDLKWDVCPYCGTEHSHDHEHDDAAAQLPGERWVDPVAIEQRLRAAEERRLLEESRALPAITTLSADDRDRLMQSLRRLEEATAANAASQNGHGPHGTNGTGPGTATAKPASSTATMTPPTNGVRDQAVPAAPTSDATGPTLPNLDEIAAPDTPAGDDDGDPTTIPDRFKVK
ncbi:MAG: zinc ribbon domain-containing protein [Thermomicrobiales bacterium]